MTLQELYKKQILEEAPTQDEQRIRQSYQLLGFRESNRAKQVLSEVQGELKPQASYLLAIIAEFEKHEELAAQHLKEASAAPEFRLLHYAYRKEEIPSDSAAEMAKALTKKKMSAYASLCECYRTLPLPSTDTRENLLQALRNDQVMASRSSFEHRERSARKAKDEIQGNADEKLETERSAQEEAREKKRSKNHPPAATSHTAVKKEFSGSVKLLFTGLKLIRFFFAYAVPLLYLFMALVNVSIDENCGGMNAVIVALPLTVWIFSVLYVKFKALKRFDSAGERVTGAWWIFYLPTTLVLIYRTFLARQESLDSAGACFATALVTCLLLVPQLVFLLPFSKTPRSRDDFYTAALCGMVCFIILPLLCIYFTDASMDSFFKGISAAVQTQK